MIHSLAVTAAQRPEVLERILRVARHRGFTVMQMQMRLEEDNVSLDIKVDSERAIELLTNQLSKLIDVIHCQVQAPVQLSKTANG